MSEATGNERQRQQDVIWQDEETPCYPNNVRMHQQENYMPVQGPPPPPGVVVGNSSLYMGQEQYGMSMHHQGVYAGDNFTVLRMSNGNFIKVYHNQDESMNYNNYELFSSNSFIPQPHQDVHNMNKPLEHHHYQQQQQQHHHQHPQQQVPQQQVPQQMVPSQNQQQQETFFHSNQVLHEIHGSVAANNNTSEENTNNIFLNQFVEKWGPNVSGTYSPFGEPTQLVQNSPHEQFTGNYNAPITADSFGFVSSSPSVQQTMFQPRHNEESIPPTVLVPTPPVMSVAPSPAIVTNTSATNGSFQHDSSIKKPEIKKTRIVAEVKPMRMTYSDVLSKNVINKNEHLPSSLGTTVTNGATNVHTQTRSSNRSSNKNTNQQHGFEKKSNTSNNLDDKDIGTNQRQNKSNTSSGARIEDNYSTNSNRDYKNGGNGTAPSSADDESKDYKSQDNDQKNSSMNKKKNGNKNNKSKQFNNDTSNIKKRTTNAGGTAGASANNLEFDQKYDEANASSSSKGCFLYNIYKNETKPSGNTQHNVRKSTANGKSIGTTDTIAMNTSSSTSTSAVRSNSKNEKSNSYQKRNQRTRQKNKYDMFAKLLEKWFEYLLRIVAWLAFLVYDVVVLSGGMLWERIHIGYDYSIHLYQVASKELKQNSGLPTAFCKSWWQRFDRRFAEESKWAIWRRIFQKKKPTEQQSEYVRSGRLPATGDEAMYSLLNCKGKDAYSILGVAADCSQEQIRKHYKKIAVLVHPDKNKQAGAEEAFKILQRAFELIGEPENRQSYDKSLAEALNAEKACSELNDLLTQLQSKIAEAANTIRCSSCGLRHPRRPTGRPHFAARECNSCKIRHTAREGDIWAETTVFGFRWKYLALMEGKVYDITEWANCQKGALSHLQPNSHIVQYRIVLGGQQQQQQQQQSQTQQQQDRVKHGNSEPTLDEFLDNLYSGQNPQTQQQNNSNRRRNRKN